MGTLLAKNATVLVTMDGTRREIAGGGLFARDGVIEQVGTTESLPQMADQVIDCTGQVLLPGLINGHHHLDQTLTRAIPQAQDVSLFSWLKAHYQIWARRTPEASRTATLVGLSELALSGCTTVFDHAYLFQNGCRVDDQIGAAREIGVRFVASRGSMSLGQSKGGLPPDSCVEREEDILVDCERVIARYHNAAPGAMTQIVLAPCSPFSVTEGLMRESASLARRHNLRLHTHLAETKDEERYTLERFGLRPVDYMASLGWLDSDVWYAHAVHLSQPDIAAMARHGTGMCHCPSSNMRLASGIAPVLACCDAGVKVGLGVDGSASNDGNHMLGEARQAMLLSRLDLGLRSQEAPELQEKAGAWMSARKALELATLGGAALLGRDDIGSLEVGKRADFFSVQLDDVGYAGALADPVAALVFCAPKRAHYTVVEGRIIVDQGRVISIDMGPVIGEHNRHARELLEAC